MASFSSVMVHARARHVAWATLSLFLALLDPVPEGGRVGFRWAGLVWAQAAVHEGFGASTPGGSGGAVVAVTNLNDSGLGSFREAVAQGQRLVVFEVGGTIELTSPVHVSGAFITIDGFTAPPPGITLRGGGLVVRGLDGAHNVIIRGLRVRGAPQDGVQIALGAHHVVVDHVSIQGSGDGNLDITEGARDITVAWSLLATPASGKNMLIKYDASRISLHHNLFFDAVTGNPLVATTDAGTPATDTTADLWNNVVSQWGGGFGTRVHAGAWVNAANNLYSSSAGGDLRQALRVCPANCADEPVGGAAGRLYASGNFSADRLFFRVNEFGTEKDPFPAPPATVDDTCLAAHQVVAGAGLRPLDPLDQQSVSGVNLPSCPGVFMQGLYYHALRRAPSDGEVEAWLDALGPTPAVPLVGAVILGFFASEEFRSVPVTPSGYAAALFRAALGRDPDGEESAFYTAQVLERFLAIVPFLVRSPEFAAVRARTTPEALVFRFFRQALGRLPTEAEVQEGIAYLMTTDDVTPGVIGALSSDDFTGTPRTFASHVHVLCRALLAREPSPEEESFLVDYLVGQLTTIGGRPAEGSEFAERVARIFPPN